LDFGRHGDRWFLVLPPTLGLPVERWRMLRRPAAADAARLALAFGRLADRVAAAGFSPDLAVLADVAVGPGPTPFLERPLLQPPAAGTPVTGDGQRVLAAVLAAALGPLAPPPGLAAWLERASAGDFPGLADCLDELELSGAADGGGAETRPPGLQHLFDEDFDLDGVIVPPPHRSRRPLLAAVPIALVAIAGALLLLGHGAHRSATAEPPHHHAGPRVTPVATAPVAPTRAKHTAARHAPRHVRKPKRHVHTHAPSAPAAHTTSTAPAPAPTTTTQPPPATTQAASPSQGTVELPAPGG